MKWIQKLLRRKRTADCFPIIEPLAKDKKGIEVGGPSGVFGRKKGLLPIYPMASAISLFDHVGMRLLVVETSLPFHIILVARKPAPNTPTNNAQFIGARATWRECSIFSEDRLPT